MKARFFCRVVRCDREGYYYTDWSKATPVVVTADNRQGAVNEASRLMGEPPHGYGGPGSGLLAVSSTAAPGTSTPQEVSRG